MSNAHGAIIGLLDITGTETISYDYDAFENQIKDNLNPMLQLTQTQFNSETDTNPFRYCGEYFDNETELIYLRNRYYDTSSGRFISEDPIKDGLNWYVYCNNDPINYVDTNGLQAYKTWGELRDGLNKYTVQDTFKANSLSEKAEKNGINYAKTNNYYQETNVWYGTKKELITWGNPADAMRHMQWNSMMTREMSNEKAIFYANNHEVAELNRLGWITKVEGDVVFNKMNQPTLMDLWNNAVGRSLASNSNLNQLNYDGLFNYAKENNLLILSDQNVYDFYGITNYINKSDWTVNVEWNVNTGNITFKKDGLSNLTLKIGI